MGTNFNPAPVESGFRDQMLLNDLFDQISQDLEDKVDRFGVAPNGMEADIDLNSFRGLNFAEGVLGTDAVNLNQVINIATDIATSIINQGGNGQDQTTGDPITFNYYIASGSQGLNNRTEFDLNTLAGVTSFLGLTVAVEGVIQTPGLAYTVTNDTLVTFSESLEPSTTILFVFGDLSPTPVFSNVNATLQETATTATAGATVFTAPTYVIGKGQLMVHIDGVMQSLTNGDYTETTTTSVTLDAAMAGGEEIVIRNISGV